MSAEKSGPRVLFAGGGTGGHLYPALALAEAFRRRSPGAAVHFVGARRGVEARVLPERGVPHTLLPFEPIRRERPWQNWRLVPAMAGSVTGLLRVFRDFRPDLVVGTGGYASGPVVAWGVARGVPTALQEQNSYPGLTTRWLARRVRQIHLAFPEALAHMRPGPATEVFEFGNPIAPPDAGIDREAARAAFGLGEGTVVLVVGGSQGARAINEGLLGDLRGVAEGRLPSPGAPLQILWGTGPTQFESVAAGVRSLGMDWVHPIPFIKEMPRALALADVAVSRAGAMALAELCAWGIPSILIPFPHAAADHQHHNAAALEAAGAAVMIREDALARGRIWSEINSLVADDTRRAEVADHARARGAPDAADRIVEALSGLL